MYSIPRFEALTMYEKILFPHRQRLVGRVLFDATLMGLEWMPQRHRDGAEVVPPFLPGPFGELRTRMADKLDKCLVAVKCL